MQAEEKLELSLNKDEVYYGYFASKRMYVDPSRALLYINTPILGVDIVEFTRDSLLIGPGEKNLYLFKADRGEKIKWAPYSALFLQSRKWDEGLILYLPGRKVEIITSKRKFTIS